MTSHDYELLDPPADVTVQRIQDNPDAVLDLDDQTLFAILGWSAGYQQKVYVACYDELHRRGGLDPISHQEGTRMASHTPTSHLYRIGDQVLMSLSGATAPGRVTGYDGQFCPTCHCDPVDPDHRGDGSLCCPGPWYQVTYTCPDGNHKHENEIYAEHELARRILCDVTCGTDCGKCITATC